MIKWLKSLFSREVKEVVKENSFPSEIIGNVTYTHPKHPLPPARTVEPPKKSPKVTANDIRSWIKSVREYDNVRTLCV